MNCRQSIIYIDGILVLTPEEFTETEKVSMRMTSLAQEKLLSDLAWGTNRILSNRGFNPEDSLWRHDD